MLFPSVSKSNRNSNFDKWFNSSLAWHQGEHIAGEHIKKFNCYYMPNIFGVLTVVIITDNTLFYRLGTFETAILFISPDIQILNSRGKYLCVVTIRSITVKKWKYLVSFWYFQENFYFLSWTLCMPYWPTSVCIIWQ